MKVYAKDMMHKDVKTVRSDLSLADLERRFVSDDVSGFPVVDDGTIQGVVSAADILRQLCEARGDVELNTAFYEEDTSMAFTSIESDWVSSEVGRRIDHLHVRDVMRTKVHSVSPETTLHDAAALMSEHKIHRVLVVDDEQLVGILSSSDIVRACASEMIDISFAPPKTRDF